MEKLKHYFIPHEGNDYRPHILGGRAVAFIVMVALVAEAAFVFSAKYVIPNSKLFGIVEANALIDETNQARQANGLSALAVSPLLTEAAQEKANDMATKGYFAHTSPQGLTPWYWFENVGYSFDYAGENLAVNFSDSQDVTNAWLNSPEHRANIMSGDFTQIGMATAQGTFNGQPAVYVVEEFGTPAPAAAPVAFVNTASAASIPTTAPQPTTVTPPGAAPTTPTAKAPAPAKKPVSAPKPVAVVPAIVAMQSAQTTSSQQSFVAVKGASATDVAPATSTNSAPASAPAQAPVAAPVRQANFMQALLSDPRSLANDFYYFLMVIFLLALVLNIFVKVRIQHPRLIASGFVVIVIAGLCVMLNQNIGFIHAVVL